MSMCGGSTGLAVGAIIGIVIGAVVCCILCIVGIICIIRNCCRKSESELAAAVLTKHLQSQGA